MSPEQHLSLLEMLAGEVAPAGRLEQGQVPAGLLISLLFQPCQCACPEEHLSEKQPGKSRRLGWGRQERQDEVPEGQAAGTGSQQARECGPWVRQSLKIHLPKSGRGGALAGLLGSARPRWKEAPGLEE